MAKVGVDIVITEKGGQVLKRTGRDIEEVGKRTKRLSSGFKALAKNWVAVSAAAAGMVIVMRKFIALSNIQEESEAALAAALEARGLLTRAAIADLKNFASELQNVTGIGDETTLMVLAQLTAMGLQGEALKKATRLSADLSVVMKTDMTAAARVMADAFSGSTGMLGRYIKGLDMADIKQRGTISIVEQLTTAIGGQAEAFGKTGAGQLAIFSAATGDVGEVMGDLVKNVIKPMLPFLTFMAQLFGKFLPIAIQAFIVSMRAIPAGFAVKIIQLGVALKALGLISTDTTDDFLTFSRGLRIGLTKAMRDLAIMIKGSEESLNKMGKAAQDVATSVDDISKAVKEIPALPGIVIPALAEPEILKDVEIPVRKLNEQFVDLSVTAADVGLQIESSFQQTSQAMVNAMLGAQLKIDQILKSIAASFIQLGIRHFVGGAFGFAIGGPAGATAGAIAATSTITGSLGKRAGPTIEVTLEGTIEGQEFQSRTFPNFEITRKRRQF